MKKENINEMEIENTKENQTNVVTKTKMNTGYKIIFYMFGVFCAFFTFIAGVGVYAELFGYDSKVEGIVTEIKRNRITDKYEVEVEYRRDGNIKTETVRLEEYPYGVKVNDKLIVKYSSKDKYDVYIPKLESISESIMMLAILFTITSVCFIAPNNSALALEKFFSIRKNIRR